MQTANKNQIIAINTVLQKMKLMDEKANIIKEATNGRTTHSSELTFKEAYQLLKALNEKPKPVDARQKMINKLFAMAHEIGWIKFKKVVTPYGMATNRDSSALYNWVKKYGYLKKDLNEYAYEELPKLLSSFEFGPYKHYISKL